MSTKNGMLGQTNFSGFNEKSILYPPCAGYISWSLDWWQEWDARETHQIGNDPIRSKKRVVDVMAEMFISTKILNKWKKAPTAEYASCLLRKPWGAGTQRIIYIILVGNGEERNDNQMTMLTWCCHICLCKSSSKTMCRRIMYVCLEK
jgi:hypothetical protein